MLDDVENEWLQPLGFLHEGSRHVVLISECHHISWRDRLGVAHFLLRRVCYLIILAMTSTQLNKSFRHVHVDPLTGASSRSTRGN